MRHNWTHGGALDQIQAQFPDVTKPWIDLSTGINPWPYPTDLLRGNTYRHLPTRSAYEACRKAMAATLGAPLNALCLGPGSELLIRLLPLWLNLSRVAILTPTYGDHAEVWQHAGCELIETSEPLELAGKVDAVIVCNPNNPDGRLFDKDALLNALAAQRKRDGWLIVDEAYCDLRPDHSLASHGGEDGLIVLRSFGKFFGLPGMRLGALIGPPNVIAQCTEQLGAWPVSAGALEIGAAAYADHEWQEETRFTLVEARRLTDLILEPFARGPIIGTDLFRYIQVEDAHAVWRHLMRAGIYVRRFETQAHDLRIGIPGNDVSLARLNEAFSLLT